MSRQYEEETCAVEANKSLKERVMELEDRLERLHHRMDTAHMRLRELDGEDEKR